MKSIGGRRGWLTFAMIDALLMLYAGSAMAAPVAGAAAAPSLPVLLLGGVGLIGFGVRHAA